MARPRVVRQDVTVRPPDDIRLSFNEAAEVYDLVRPSYPADLFDVLFQMLPTDPEIVEVGPGTGQATKDLLARTASVHAIEIGPAMAARLRSNLPSDRLRVTVGDFEDVIVAPCSADSVFASTAYHWISRAAQTDRSTAILRRGGIMAIVDGNGDLGTFTLATGILGAVCAVLAAVIAAVIFGSTYASYRDTLAADASTHDIPA